LKRDLARELFRVFKTPISERKHRQQKVARAIHPIDNGDPLPLKEVLSDLIEGRDWTQALAEGNLFALWAEVVGDDVAEHSEPITLLDGRLTIRASSTAWATQLTLLIPTLLEKIKNSAPGVLVDELVVLGPTAPSWRKGLRTIKGFRGPRDTYG